MAIATGTAILAGALGAGAIGAYSSNQAAGAAQAASNASVAEQRRQFNALMDRSQPFNQAAVTGLNSLLAMEGLPTVAAPQTGQPYQPPTSITQLPFYKQELYGNSVRGRPSLASSFLKAEQF